MELVLQRDRQESRIRRENVHERDMAQENFHLKDTVGTLSKAYTHGSLTYFHN